MNGYGSWAREGARIVLRWLLKVSPPSTVRDSVIGRTHSFLMETEVVCQHCSKRLHRHCTGCLWLVCPPCEMIIGPYNVIYYGDARKRQEESLKRQNGV